MFMGYSSNTILTLLSRINGHYSRILVTDLAANDQKMREPFNPYKPLEILYTRITECIDYATAAGKPVPEGHVVRISYGLVLETGQFQDECRNLRSKAELENTWNESQANFIKAKADLCK